MGRLVVNPNKFHKKRLVDEYRRQMKDFVMTARYNNLTWKENRDYCTNHNHVVIYGVPVPISRKLPLQSLLFILEMNNDENRIMGIGMVKNTSHYYKHSIYTNTNFNRFTYVGRYRIDRTEMNEEEERILQILDRFCFTGTKHCKRGASIKMFSVEMLYNCHDLLDIRTGIKNMFKRKYKN